VTWPGAKLLPGLLHLFQVGMITDFRVVGTSLEDLDDEMFVKHTRDAVDEFSGRPVSDEQWATFAGYLSYAPGSSGPRGPAGRSHGRREAAGRSAPAPALPQRAA
jgi:hypothetical protein